MPVALPEFDDSFPVIDGYPRADWDALRRWVERAVPEGECHELTTRVERLWLRRLADHLGGDYAVSESARFLLLSEQSAAERDTFLAAAEDTLDVVEDSLELPAEAEAVGKIPVIVFVEDDDYYDYISHYFPNGHYGLTSGVCIREGDVHLAMHCHEPFVRRTFAHELTHACLAHRDLPLWLEQGVCEVVSRRAVDEGEAEFEGGVRDHHYAYWSWHGLESFWSGASFSRPDELQSLSYVLAEMLVRRMNTRDPERFGRLLLTAAAADGGESAARACFGLSLVALVAELLGEGPWLPPSPQSFGEAD